MVVVIAIIVLTSIYIKNKRKTANFRRQQGAALVANSAGDMNTSDEPNATQNTAINPQNPVMQSPGSGTITALKYFTNDYALK